MKKKFIHQILDKNNNKILHSELLFGKVLAKPQRPLTS